MNERKKKEKLGEQASDYANETVPKSTQNVEYSE